MDLNAALVDLSVCGYDKSFFFVKNDQINALLKRKDYRNLAVFIIIELRVFLVAILSTKVIFQSEYIIFHLFLFSYITLYDVPEAHLTALRHLFLLSLLFT